MAMVQICRCPRQFACRSEHPLEPVMCCHRPLRVLFLFDLVACERTRVQFRFPCDCPLASRPVTRGLEQQQISLQGSLTRRTRHALAGREHATHAARERDLIPDATFTTAVSIGGERVVVDVADGTDPAQISLQGCGVRYVLRVRRSAA